MIGKDHLRDLTHDAIKHRDSGAIIRQFDNDPTHEYHHVAVSHDGKWAAGCGHVLDHPRPTEYFALVPTGSVCFAAVFNLETGQQDFFRLTADTDTWTINSIEFSPQDDFLVTAGGDSIAFSRVDLFAKSNGRFRHLEARESPHHANDLNWEVVDIAFSSMGQYVGTVSMSGVARIWSLDNQHWKPNIFRKGGLYALAFSPDGRILAIGNSAGIQLCDLRTQFPLATIPVAGGASALAFSPDGRVLAWSSRNGRVHFLRASPTLRPHESFAGRE